MNHERFDLARPLDLQLAVLRAQRSALLRGATDLERAVIATIVSELGSNVLKYAGRGRLEVRRLRRGVAADVEITAWDAGPGIPDVALALRDHYSTGRTLGLGLPGVRRMADELEIVANRDGGTTVRVRKRLSGARGPSPADGVEPDRDGRLVACGAHWRAAARVRPRAGAAVGGDHAVAVDRGAHALFAVIDVTGHGAAAHALATALTARLQHAFVSTADADDAARLLHAVHDAAVGTAGAAAGVAVVDAASERMTYLAVGNVRAAVVGPRRFTGVARDGLLGRRWPTPFVQHHPLGPGDLLLLWTDGLPETLARSAAARIDGVRSPGTGVRSPGAGGRPAIGATDDPAALADALVSAHGKRHDDAACLVARWDDA